MKVSDAHVKLLPDNTTIVSGMNNIHSNKSDLCHSIERWIGKMFPLIGKILHKIVLDVATEIIVVNWPTQPMV